MKKTISIIVALAMVFVLSFSAFATEEGFGDVKPTDPTELGVYYAELLNAEGSDPAAVAAEMIDDLITGEEGDEGIYTVEDLPVVLTAFAENAEDITKLTAALEQIEKGLTDMGIEIPEIQLPETSLPEGDGGEDESLPEDEEESDDSDFLNTILGILGSVGDMIFGSGGDTDTDTDVDTDTDTGDDAWGDEDADLDDGSDDELVSDTGDTTVISVAAVALVAGAALVLTRKKSEDAE